MTKTTHFCFAMLFVFIAAAEAQAQSAGNFCRFGGVRFCDGCVLSRRILTRPGNACVFTSFAGSGMLLGSEILERPRLGHFGQANQSQSAYKAGAAAGADFFVYRVKWEKLGRVNSAIVRNHVTIQPGAR